MHFGIHIQQGERSAIGPRFTTTTTTNHPATTITILQPPPPPKPPQPPQPPRPPRPPRHSHHHHATATTTPHQNTTPPPQPPPTSCCSSLFDPSNPGASVVYDSGLRVRRVLWISLGFAQRHPNLSRILRLLLESQVGKNVKLASSKEEFIAESDKRASAATMQVLALVTREQRDSDEACWMYNQGRL